MEVRNCLHCLFVKAFNGLLCATLGLFALLLAWRLLAFAVGRYVPKGQTLDSEFTWRDFHKTEGSSGRKELETWASKWGEKLLEALPLTDLARDGGDEWYTVLWHRCFKSQIRLPPAAAPHISVQLSCCYNPLLSVSTWHLHLVLYFLNHGLHFIPIC